MLEKNWVRGRLNWKRNKRSRNSSGIFSSSTWWEMRPAAKIWKAPRNYVQISPSGEFTFCASPSVFSFSWATSWSRMCSLFIDVRLYAFVHIDFRLHLRQNAIRNSTGKSWRAEHFNSNSLFCWVSVIASVLLVFLSISLFVHSCAPISHSFSAVLPSGWVYIRLFSSSISPWSKFIYFSGALKPVTKEWWRILVNQWLYVILYSKYFSILGAASSATQST